MLAVSVPLLNSVMRSVCYEHVLEYPAEIHTLIQAQHCMGQVVPGLLLHLHVVLASNKCWGEKAWEKKAILSYWNTSVRAQNCLALTLHTCRTPLAPSHWVVEDASR